MTYLELVNSVLKRLREDTVSSVTENKYSTMIGEFVNDIKEEVEEAHDWMRLRRTLQIVTSTGVFRYTLTGAGDRFRVISIFDDTNDNSLKQAPSQEWMNRMFNTGTQTNSHPGYYDFNGYSGDDTQMDMWPIPDGIYTINCNFVIPQAKLSSNTDALIVPYQPVILGAYAKAVSERGEDGGISYQEADDAFHRSLNRVASIDAYKFPNEQEWYV